MASIVAAILALGVLIIIHEAGHFLAARWSGMSVRRFSVGFGPPLFKTRKWGTEFQVGMIPLGGFVQIDGMNPHDGTDPEAPGSYLKKPFHMRFATILAGPFANYVLGFGLLFLFFGALYVEELAPVRVVRVVGGSAAAEAGLEPGDLITGTSSAAFERAEELRDTIGAAGPNPIHFSVERDGARSIRVVTPRPTGTGSYLIGIAYEGTDTRRRSLPPSVAAGMAWDKTVEASTGLLFFFRQLLRPGAKEEVEVSGPIGIVRGLSRVVERSLAGAVFAVGHISVVLGFFNLLPIPALDGSRLLFLLLGVVRRREVNPRVEAVVHAVGLVLLLGLLLVISVFDVLR